MNETPAHDPDRSQDPGAKPAPQEAERVPTASSDDTTPSPDAQKTTGGTPNEEKVLEALRNVIDPELFVNIVDLGLIYEVDLADGADGAKDVKIDMTMTSPMCPAGPQLIGQSKQFVGQLDGIGEVEVKIVLDPPWTPDRMTEEARDQLGIF